MAISVSAYGWSGNFVSPDYTVQQIIEFSYTEGRSTIADPVGGGVLTFTCFATNNTSFGINNRIEFYLVIDGVEKQIQNGYITDLELEYDFVTSQDKYRVTVSDTLSLAMSAASGPGDSGVSQDTTYQAYDVLLYGFIPRYVMDVGKSIASAWTSPINIGDRIQLLLNTEQGGWDFRASDGALRITARNITAPITKGFSTSSTDFAAEYWRSSEWTAGTFSRTYYNRVRVQPEGLTEQVADAGGSTRRSTLTIKSADANTTQAKNLADYLLATFKFDALSMVEVGCTLNQNMDTYASVHKGRKLADLTPRNRPIIENKFRGTTQYALVLGRTISGVIGEVTRFRFMLAPQQAVSWLVLNDSVLGKLDNNKLGF